VAHQAAVERSAAWLLGRRATLTSPGVRFGRAVRSVSRSGADLPDHHRDIVTTTARKRQFDEVVRCRRPTNGRRLCRERSLTPRVRISELEHGMGRFALYRPRCVGAADAGPGMSGDTDGAHGRAHHQPSSRIVTTRRRIVVATTRGNSAPRASDSNDEGVEGECCSRWSVVMVDIRDQVPLAVVATM
jgi:hypothetical protein